MNGETAPNRGVPKVAFTLVREDSRQQLGA